MAEQLCTNIRPGTPKSSKSSPA